MKLRLRPITIDTLLLAALLILLLVKIGGAHDAVGVTVHFDDGTTKGFHAGPAPSPSTLPSTAPTTPTTGSATMPSTQPIVVETLEQRLLAANYDAILYVGPNDAIKNDAQLEAKLTSNDAVIVRDGYVMPVADGLRIKPGLVNVYIGSAGRAGINYTGTSGSASIIDDYGVGTTIENLHLTSNVSLRKGGNAINAAGRNPDGVYTTVRNVTFEQDVKYGVHHRGKVVKHSSGVWVEAPGGASGLIVENCIMPVVSDYLVWSDPLTSRLIVRNNVVGDSKYEHPIRTHGDDTLIEGNDFSNPRQADGSWKTSITVQRGRNIIVRNNLSRVGMFKAGPLADGNGDDVPGWETWRVENLLVEGNEFRDCPQVKLEWGLIDFRFKDNKIAAHNTVFTIGSTGNGKVGDPGYDPNRYRVRGRPSGVIEGTASTGKLFMGGGDFAAIWWRDLGNTLNGVKQ